MAQIASRGTTAGRTTGWAALLLAAVVVLAYAGSVHVPFVFDDAGAVVTNPTIRRLDSWSVLNPPADGSTTTGRPLVNLSYALNYAISGDRPWSYHAMNIAIHAANALLLMGIVGQTLRRRRAGGFPERRVAAVAFVAAAIWALHPLQTETVVTIAQRTESLCGLFYLLTLYAFIRATESEAASRGWAAVSVFACLCGMATKEVMVTAPIVVLLYDRTFLAGTFVAGWRSRRRYYFAVAGTWVLLAVLVLRSAGARGASAGFGLGVSWWHYLLQQSEALALYLKLSVWPHPLVLDYGTGVPNSLAAVAGPAVVVVALLVAAIWALVRRPVAGFFAATFFVLLAPSSSIVPLVTQTMAEHRMYLPLAALVVPLVLMGERTLRDRMRPAVAGFVVVALGCLTIARVALYGSPLSIWRNNVASYPSSARGHENLAVALQHAGRSTEADAEFSRAIALEPNYVTARYSWGVALQERGRLPEAIAQFETVVRLAPNHADAHVNLGNALVAAGRPADALPHFEAALRLQPAADAEYNYGVALLALDRGAGAAEHFRAAVELDPALAEPHFQLGRLAEHAGRNGEAETEYTATLKLAPNHVGAHARLGLLLAQTNRLSAATDHLQTALKLQPDNADVRANLGNVLLLQGRPREAIACYEEVLRQRPGDARTRENLELAREALR
jgi:protein O-mannosyl-transferase